MIDVPDYADDAPASSPPPPSPRFNRRRIALGIGAGLLLLFAWMVWALPLNRALEPLPDPTLVLMDRNGEPFARRGAYKEAPVDVAALPEHVSAAIIAIEDRRFRQHFGVDLRGIARAAVRNARAGEVRQGGSTITQQLAKTAFLEPERTFRRKIREAIIAVYLEARLSKDEILSRYLSAVYFGDGVYGLRAAAKHYFDKEPEKLSIGEAAMLAGLVKAPSRLAPTVDLEAARERTRLVLAAMVETGAITEAEARKARKPRIREGRASLPVGTWFADWVAPQAKDAFGADYGEIAVRTTLDARLQKHAQRVVQRWLARQGRRQGASQAALVAMRPNGEVLALVGGRDYKQSQFDRVTQAKRQPGSAFKLFTYWAALGAGATPAMLVEDRPLTLGDWSPANYDDRYAGVVPLRDAFAQSSNVAAVRLIDRVGPRAVVDAARQFGIRSDLGDDATLALGTSEVTLLELTAAYAALAAGAAPVTPHGVPAMRGDAPMQPLDPNRRAAMLDLLWGVVDHGTGRAARLRVPAFGKTGTTQGYRDAIFVGMAGDLVVGLWVGNDDGTPMKGVTGGGLPALMWRDFMDDALALYPGQGAAPRRAPQFVAVPAPRDDFVVVTDEATVYGDVPVAPSDDPAVVFEPADAIAEEPLAEGDAPAAPDAPPEPPAPVEAEVPAIPAPEADEPELEEEG